jgi:hypothetical protein
VSQLCCLKAPTGLCQETTYGCPDPYDRVRCPEQGSIAKYGQARPINRPGERSTRPPLAPFAEANTIQQVRRRRAPCAERAIRGFALRLAEKGNWNVVSNNPPPTVDASHDELSARSMR